MVMLTPSASRIKPKFTKRKGKKSTSSRANLFQTFVRVGKGRKATLRDPPSQAPDFSSTQSSINFRYDYLYI